MSAGHQGKFYFVVYVYEKLRGSLSSSFKPRQELLKDQHPVQWQIDTNRLHGDEGTYTVLSWQEISKEEFEKFDGHIG